MLYVCAITAMLVSAVLARFENSWIALGAGLFLISDSILAVNKFKTEVPLRDYLVWATYYAAQYAIAAGFLLPKRA
jgi:alkenylglycerophosphocholine hydrolase